MRRWVSFCASSRVGVAGGGGVGFRRFQGGFAHAARSAGFFSEPRTDDRNRFIRVAGDDF